MIRCRWNERYHEDECYPLIVLTVGDRLFCFLDQPLLGENYLGENYR